MYWQNNAIQVEIYIQKTKNYIQVQTTESDTLMCIIEQVISREPNLVIPKCMLFYINAIEVDPYIQLGRVKQNLGLNVDKLKVKIAQIQQIVQLEKSESKQPKKLVRNLSFSFRGDSDKNQFSDQCAITSNHKDVLEQSLIRDDDDQIKKAVNEKQFKLQNQQRYQMRLNQQRPSENQKQQKLEKPEQQKKSEQSEQILQNKQEIKQEIKFMVRIQHQDLHDIRQIIVDNCEETTTLNSILRKRKEQIPDFECQQFIYIINNLSIRKEQLKKPLKGLPKEWIRQNGKNQEILIKMITKYDGG